MAAQATLAPLLLLAEDFSKTQSPRPSPYRRRVRELIANIESISHEGEDRFLLATALREAKQSTSTLSKLVHVELENQLVPRPLALAIVYLKGTNGAFEQQTLIEFINGLQATAPLGMDELWGLRSAMLVALLERYAGGAKDSLDSIRLVANAIWEDLFASICVVDHILGNDPIGAYNLMDDESREAYRNAIRHLARHSSRTETEIASTAVALAAAVPEVPPSARAFFRRRHVGFYLLDQGKSDLEQRIGYRPPLRMRLARWVLNSPTGFYLAGVEVATFLVAIFLISGLPSLTPILGGLALLLLPATHAAVSFMNDLATAIVLPRFIPKLNFENGVPDEFPTVVAVPVLLISEPQVRTLVRDLEVRYLANAGPNVRFGLLTDLPDAPELSEDGPDSLTRIACQSIDELNRRYGSGDDGPFFLLHRFRSFNRSEGAWIGWERKRGKLLDLNSYVGGIFDAFPVKRGSTDAVKKARFVITLDADTQLPPGAAAKLIGALAHPLNRAVVGQFGQVVEGYGIIQPRVSVSVQSAARSRLAQTYSGQTGFDIYTRAISDVYQDLFGEGIFTGKGIYEIAIFRRVLENRFPTNQLLSHDLMEGIYARAGLATDIEVVDDYPSHYSAYSRRQHRWIRGDWQVLRWLLPVVPDSLGHLGPNPISLISRWKIADNVRRSLIRPATLLLLLAGWFILPGPPGYWTLAIAALLLIPIYSPLLFSPFRSFKLPSRRAFVADVGQLIQNHLAAVLEVTFLIDQALSSLDAIVRSLVRTRITRRRLLEWETAHQAEGGVRKRAPVDLYLQLSPVVAAIIAVLLVLYVPISLPEAAPVLLLWALAPLVSRWLNKPPTNRETILSEKEKEHLTEIARKTWRYFEEFSTTANHYLIPDNTRLAHDPDQRISPTNLGLLLNTRVAAVELGFLPLERFIELSRATLSSMLKMERHAGHFYNWYDTRDLRPLPPIFVSTVDSGNLVVALWALKQACLAWSEDAKAEIASALNEIAAIADNFANEMDFRMLYSPERKSLSVGYDAAASKRTAAAYDLLASEARMAVFSAIALGQISHKTWLHLGRAHTAVAGKRILIAWSGTAFEYLMPALWMRSYDRSLLAGSMESILKVQQHSAGRKRPWGISECAYGSNERGDFSYGPVGLPEIAMQPDLFTGPVVSPYSTMLAMMVNPREALKNLTKMERMGWLGEYGFYESADYSPMREDPSATYCLIRTWMAHHQGMSLVALANVLRDNCFQKFFHAEPRVEACERLLHEKLPADLPIVKAVFSEGEHTPPQAQAAAA